MRKSVLFALAAGLLLIGTAPMASQSATIGYIMVEAIQQGFLGIDMNAEEDAEDLIFIAEAILLEQQPSSAGIVNHIQHLQDQGHTVNWYGSQTDDILGLEYMEANNDLIIVSENPSSAETGTFYANSNIPVIICESYVLDDHQVFDDWDIRCFCDEDINAREFRVAREHPITQGFDETFAPLAIDEDGSGLPYVGNWSVLAEGDRVTTYQENVLLTLVDPVAPIPQENDYILTEPVPVLWAFEPGEMPLGNNARYIFFGWGTENATGIGLEADPLFADGSTAGIYAFDVVGEQGWRLWDSVVNWALGVESGVDTWSVH